MAQIWHYLADPKGNRKEKLGGAKNVKFYNFKGLYVEGLVWICEWRLKI